MQKIKDHNTYMISHPLDNHNKPRAENKLKTRKDDSEGYSPMPYLISLDLGVRQWQLNRRRSRRKRIWTNSHKWNNVNKTRETIKERI